MIDFENKDYLMAIKKIANSKKFIKFWNEKKWMWDRYNEDGDWGLDGKLKIDKAIDKILTKEDIKKVLPDYIKMGYTPKFLIACELNRIIKAEAEIRDEKKRAVETITKKISRFNLLDIKEI
jgi:hypothetical protein